MEFRIDCKKKSLNRNVGIILGKEDSSAVEEHDDFLGVGGGRRGNMGWRTGLAGARLWGAQL
jgi:hypothetical protein